MKRSLLLRSADAVRMLTTVIRKERFVDGQLVGSIEDGTVPAALERMCTWWAEDA
ncbi:MAG: DUF6508 domain-containing protein [Acidimicrobiia bacterium]|nr:DUF6508 domain-containing protein [Acidimicrobiia bacterium]